MLNPDKDSDQRRNRSQLTDAATSTAAYYRAACRAKPRADFINELGGAIEEVDESALWLELLAEAGISPRGAYDTAAERSRRADEDLRAVPRDGKNES